MSSDSHVETEYLGWWWGLWIISGIFGQVVYRYSRIAISIDELTTSTILAIIDVLLGIVLATITIKIIKDYTKLEPLIFEIKETDTIEPKVEVINA
jgi:hypothetical protein